VEKCFQADGQIEKTVEAYDEVSGRFTGVVLVVVVVVVVVLSSSSSKLLSPKRPDRSREVSREEFHQLISGRYTFRRPAHVPAQLYGPHRFDRDVPGRTSGGLSVLGKDGTDHRLSE